MDGDVLVLDRRAAHSRDEGLPVRICESFSQNEERKMIEQIHAPLLRMTGFPSNPYLRTKSAAAPSASERFSAILERRPDNASFLFSTKANDLRAPGWIDSMTMMVECRDASFVPRRIRHLNPIADFLLTDGARARNFWGNMQCVNGLTHKLKGIWENGGIMMHTTTERKTMLASLAGPRRGGRQGLQKV
jgi:hypothetical protein